MAINNTTYRLLVEKLGNSDPSLFVGNEGEVFYDPDAISPIFKLSDGSTPGGIPFDPSVIQDLNVTDYLHIAGIGVSPPPSTQTKLFVGGESEIASNLSVSGIVTSFGGFISGISTAAVEITISGNRLVFTAAGIGSTSFILS
jgi:hypothetical protein